MAEASGEERNEGRTGPRLRRLPGGSSRSPVEEVSVQREAVGRALFGVELRRENIIARERRGKAAPVVGLAGTVALIRRAGIEAVHEIEVARVGNAAPERIRRIDLDLILRVVRHAERPIRSASPWQLAVPVAWR